LGEEDEEERRRVHAAVVGRVRHLARPGQLAPADLVEDLARLLLAIVVDPLSLVRRHEEERVPRDFRVQEQRLEAGDERVAAERRAVPGNARGDDRPSVPMDGERLEIGRGLLDGAIEGLVGGPYAGRLLRPGFVGVPGAQDPLLEDARLGRRRLALAAWIPVAGVRLLAPARRRL